MVKALLLKKGIKKLIKICSQNTQDYYFNSQGEPFSVALTKTLLLISLEATFEVYAYHVGKIRILALENILKRKYGIFQGTLFSIKQKIILQKEIGAKYNFRDPIFLDSKDLVLYLDIVVDERYNTPAIEFLFGNKILYFSNKEKTAQKFAIDFIKRFKIVK